jgi:hypothetical protein
MIGYTPLGITLALFISNFVKLEFISFLIMTIILVGIFLSLGFILGYYEYVYFEKDDLGEFNENKIRQRNSSYEISKNSEEDTNYNKNLKESEYDV